MVVMSSGGSSLLCVCSVIPTYDFPVSVCKLLFTVRLIGMLDRLYRIH